MIYIICANFRPISLHFPYIKYFPKLNPPFKAISDKFSAKLKFQKLPERCAGAPEMWFSLGSRSYFIHWDHGRWIDWWTLNSNFKLDNNDLRWIRTRTLLRSKEDINFLHRMYFIYNNFVSSRLSETYWSRLKQLELADSSVGAVLGKTHVLHARKDKNSYRGSISLDWAKVTWIGGHVERGWTKFISKATEGTP